MSITADVVQHMIELVNTQGFAACSLDADTIGQLGEPLYNAIDSTTLHPDRGRYYNEIAFHWPEDWADVENGLLSFHDEKSLKHIHTKKAAERRLLDSIGADLTNEVIDFASHIRTLTTESHYGLENNELRLARVMVRQMGETDTTVHVGSDWHEDIGYSNRSYQQLLSVIITTWGKPTEALRYSPKAGELLMFNAFDRRRLLGLSEEFAFIHRGPNRGPKMFFFFEFLGPRDSY